MKNEKYCPAAKRSTVTGKARNDPQARSADQQRSDPQAATPPINSDGQSPERSTGGNAADRQAIYAQKFSINGDIQWALNGVLASTHYGSPRLITDGHVGFQPDTFHVYSHKIDTTGHLLWDSSGFAVCEMLDIRERPTIAADPDGGAFVTWVDYRDRRESLDDIYIQRVSSGGSIGGDTSVTSIRTTASPPFEFTLRNYPNPFNPETTI